MITLVLLLAAVQPAIDWKQLEPGLELAVVGASIKSSHNDSKFTLVRIDPEKHDLKLLMVSELGGKKRTAPKWAKQYKLSVAVNAGMFEAYGDQSTAHFYMQNYKHINNPKIAGQNAFLAFNRKDDSVPRVQIVDRRCQDFKKLRKKYHTIIQGIRMVDCNQKNTWSLQKKKWSMVVVAVDKKGRVLFIFTRSPYRVHNYIKMLLALPLQIHNMMYLEGGPEASFYVDAGKTKIEKFGSYETGFNEDDNNSEFWPIPNVIGVAKKVSPEGAR
jgi:uncharacterized protein YigE (DUF2233 family)